MVEAVMTVGPKGQVVIPKPFRDAYGISPFDKVVIKGVKEGIVVVKQKAGAVELFKKIAFSKKLVVVDIQKYKRQFEDGFPKSLSK